jgi:hypothetical protein
LAHRTVTFYVTGGENHCHIIPCLSLLFNVGSRRPSWSRRRYGYPDNYRLHSSAEGRAGTREVRRKEGGGGGATRVPGEATRSTKVRDRAPPWPATRGGIHRRLITQKTKSFALSYSQLRISLVFTPTLGFPNTWFSSPQFGGFSISFLYF